MIERTYVYICVESSYVQMIIGAKTIQAIRLLCACGRKADANPPLMTLCACCGKHIVRAAPSLACIRKNLQTGSMRIHYFLSASNEPPI